MSAEEKNPIKDYLYQYSTDRIREKLKKSERKVQYLRTKLLYEIYSNDGLTRAEIAEVLDFTIPQVSLFLSHLFDIGIIRVVEDIDQKKKRKIKRVKLNSENFILLGFKIDPGKIESVVTNSDREIIDHSTVHFPMDVDHPEQDKKIQEIILHHIYNMTDEFISKYQNICGIGIASAGIVNYKNQSIIAFPKNFNWREFFLRKEVENKFSLPIIVTGLGSAKTRFYSFLDELKDLKGKKDFLYLSIDDIISMGMYYSKHIFRNSVTEELGIEHIVIDKNGPQCYCGNRGCLNIYSSFISTKDRILNEIKKGVNTTLSNYSEYFTFADLLTEAKGGDSLANKMLRESIDKLSFALGNTINFLNPDILIITGFFTKHLKYYQSFIKEYILEQLTPLNRDRIQIKLENENKYAAPVGAALAILEEIFDFNYYIQERLL